MIPIVFITDNKYFMPTMVTIQSIVKNREQSNPLIYIVGIKLSKENEDFIDGLDIEDIEIEYKTIDFSLYESFFVGEGQYVSIAALVKFQLADLFEKYDKILYLDGDIIVRHSLEQFTEIELGDYYAAVVKDLMAIKQKDSKRLGLNSYFNSGVLLLNCKKIREDSLFEKMIYEKKNNHSLHYMDQDVFNIVFQNNVRFTSVIYNYQAYYNNLSLENINFRFEEKYKDRHHLEGEIVILHLAGRCKPWNCKTTNYFNEWYSYYLLLKRDVSELKNVPYIIDKKLYQKIYEGDADTVVKMFRKEMLRRHIYNGKAKFTFLGKMSFDMKYIL